MMIKKKRILAWLYIIAAVILAWFTLHKFIILLRNPDFRLFILFSVMLMPLSLLALYGWSVLEEKILNDHIRGDEKDSRGTKQ